MLRLTFYPFVLPVMLVFIAWDINPQVFASSEIPRWYGVFWFAGLALSYYLLTQLYKKDGKSVAAIDDLTLYVIGGTFLGARLGHVLFYNPGYYWAHPLEILLPFKFDPEFQFVGYEGLASHGAAFGILGAILIYSKRKGENYFRITDDIVILTALTGGFIRLGNLMNSEMIGTPTTVPWAFVFSSLDDIPRHPAQLYEAIFCFILFGALLMMRLRPLVQPPGLMTGIFFVTLFTERFLNEFVKINQEAFEDHLWLNMGQILSIPLIVAGIVLIFFSRRGRTAEIV